jgi:hypothetical protein
MKRYEDWPDRLVEEAEHHARLPFEYGVSDCLTFPLSCVEAMTGERLWADDWGPTTKMGAAKLLAKHGFSNVAEAFASEFEEIHPSQAGRGDLGVIEAGDVIAGVIFIGSYAIGKDPDVGTQHVRRNLVTRAFRVPE